MSLFRSGIRSPLVGLESSVRSSGVSGRLVSIVTMMSRLVVRSIVISSSNSTYDQGTGT